MAFVKDTLTPAKTQAASGSTTVDISSLNLAQNDVLIVWAETSTGGFTNATGNNDGSYGAANYSHAGNNELHCWVHLVGATPDTQITFTVSTTNPHQAFHFQVLDDVDTADIVEAQNSSGSNTISPVMPVITTAETDCLLVGAVISGTNSIILPPEKYHISGMRTDGINVGICGFWSFQAATTTTSADAMTIAHTAAKNYSCILLAINNATSGRIPGYVDSAPVEYVHVMGYDTGSGHLSDNTVYNPTDSGTDEGISALTNGSYTTTDVVYFLPIEELDFIADGWNATIWQNTSSANNNDLICSGVGVESGGSNINISAELIICGTRLSATDVLGESKVGVTIGFSDKTNARFFQLPTSDSTPPSTDGKFPCVIDMSLTDYVMDDIGTPNMASVGAVIYGHEPTTVNRPKLHAAPIAKMRSIKIAGGTAANPVGMEVARDYVRWFFWTVQNQGGLSTTQWYVGHNTQDGTGGGSGAASHTSYRNQSFVYPSAGQINFKTNAATFEHRVYKANTSDSADYRESSWDMGNFGKWIIDASTANADIYQFGGCVVASATPTLQNLSNMDISGLTIRGSKQLTHNGKSLSGVTVSNVATGETAAIVFDGSTSTAITWALGTPTLTNNTNAPALQITSTAAAGAVTIDLTGVVFSGNTTDVHFESTNNCQLTVTTDQAGLVGTASVGSTISFVEPTIAVTVNTNVAATIRIFDGASTQTITASGTGVTTQAHEYTGTHTWYYTVDAKGYLPQRGNFGALTSESATATVNLVADPIYNASHGLTWNATTSPGAGEIHFDDTGKVLYLADNQEGRDIYSAMIDAWFDGETEILNRPFPLKAIGPDRIDFLSDGTTGATINSGDIQFWKGAGMQWEHNTTGNPTKKFYSIKSSNTLQTSSVVGYTQTNTGTPVEATLVSNQVNQVIQFYEDTNGDGTPDYDRKTHLLFKGFLTGYYQARWDVINDGGITELEPYEYTISLTQEAISGTTGDQAVTITTLTDHSASPLVVGGKNFNFELADPGTNTAAVLLAQHNYNVYNAVNTSISGALYTSYQAFDLPDLIVEAGSNYETEAGHFEGEDAVTDREGVYLSRGGSDHPDITAFQSNDLSDYTPAVTANWTGTNLPDDAGANTLLQISNLSAVNGMLWATGQTITAGAIRLRSTGAGSESTAGLYFRAENSGTTHATTEPTWDTTPGNTTSDNGITWRCYKILFYDQDPAGTGASGSYIDGEDFAAGEQATIAFYHQNADVSFESGSTVAAVAASGFAFDASNFVTADPVYASNAIDGSTRTEFTADYAVSGTVEVDVSSDIDSSPENAYAWYCYSLTTSAGAWLFAGAITAIDEGNYRNNTAVASVKFDNTTTGSVSLQGTGSRFFRDDGANPVKDPTTSGFGVGLTWELPVYLKTQTLSGSNVITGDIADLNDPSVAEIVAGIEGGTMAGRVTSILTDTADMQPRVVSIESITDLLTLAGITSAVWSAQPSAYTTNNTMGKVIKGIQEGWLSAEGEVDDVSPSTTQFVTTLPSAVDDFYAGNPLTFTSGVLAGQSRVISAYNGTTKQVTLDHALASAPANGDSFNVLADHVHTIDEIQSGLATSAELVDPASRIAELWALLGLDVADPITISSSGHTGTAVNITITDNGNGSVTLQRV